MTVMDIDAAARGGGTWPEPSLRAVFGRSFLGGQIGRPAGSFDIVTGLLFALIFALAYPFDGEIDDLAPILSAGLFVVALVLVQGWDQLRAGRGWSRAAAAIAGMLAGVAVLV